MFWPSSLAGPVNGAEIPNRISLSVIPRTVGAGSLAPPTAARRPGASLAGCATVGAIGRLAVGEFGCGVVGAIARLSVGELACSGIFELSDLDVSSIVFVPDRGALPNMDRNSPVANNAPITAPNAAAMTKPPLTANHPSLREGG